ncbi:MAG: GerW family sporulation protein [Oscillospiraceae bacterium]|jgi:sporulation protein YtfJ|nr:GerW family sporulation protein [Oscillospiraceae bacterium]
MAEHLEGLMGTSMDKIRELIDVNTIIGEAITAPDGTVIIPVSKVSFGFVSGGSDIPASPAPKGIFAGGAGAGVTIKPMTFIIVKTDGDVKLLEAGPKDNNILESIFESAPEFLEKMKGLFAKNKNKGDFGGAEREKKPR